MNILSLPCIVLWIIIPCKVCFLADCYHIIDYKNKAKILPLLIHCLDWKIDNRSFNAKLNTYLDKECKDGKTNIIRITRTTKKPYWEVKTSITRMSTDWKKNMDTLMQEERNRNTDWFSYTLNIIWAYS
jgi:hypothetical protein